MRQASMGKRSIRWSITVVAVVSTALATVVLGAAAAGAADECDRIVWNSQGRIVAADTDGANRAQVTFADPSYDPQWSPDGSRLMWRQSVNSGPSEIVVAAADGANAAVVSGATGASFGAEWSPDGTRIAWGGNQSDSTGDLFVANANGSNRTNIAVVSGGADPTENEQPSWSWDGTRIAWLGVVPGQNYGIFVADADGMNRTEIPNAGGTPEWSPDGTQIAWATAGKAWVADTDGENRYELASAAPGPAPTVNFSPQWSPDGNRIVWSARDPATGNQEIYAADADGMNRILISTADGAEPAPGLNEGPQWSPDGMHIVWSGRDSVIFAQAIFVAAADGSNRRQISSVGANPVRRKATEPQWIRGAGACGGGNSSGPGGFTDVAADAFYADAVVWLKAEGITTGTSATTYSPDDTVTRGQMAAFLHRLVGEPGGSSAHGFTDVSSGAFYADAVAWLKAEGITTGTSATTYSPDDTVTRGQMAAFLHRLAGTPGGSSAHGFADVSSGAFYADAVAWLKAQNITTGTSASTYSPNDTVTRGQMAAFLNRMATNSDWIRPS